MITIHPATRDDIETLVPLVDAYRQFYRQPADLEGARRFLHDRFFRSDAHLLIAKRDEQPVGFTQLFPVPSTTDLAPRWILNDLFVHPEARRHGAGTALLEAARELAAAHGVPRMMLRTQIENTIAQSRYEALGWQRDEAFHTYLLTV